MTRADMESAYGAPIVTSGRHEASGSVIGVNQCGCDPISHDGRSVSNQTQGGVEQEHGLSFQAAMAKAVRVRRRPGRFIDSLVTRHDAAPQIDPTWNLVIPYGSRHDLGMKLLFLHRR